MATFVGSVVAVGAPLWNHSVADSAGGSCFTPLFRGELLRGVATL